jgi:hypothetical protein
MGVAERGDDAAFLQEALEEVAALVVGGIQGLQHDLALQGLLNGEVNRRHSAPADGALYVKTRDFHTPDYSRGIPR